MSSFAFRFSLFHFRFSVFPMLGEERRNKILERVRPLLAEIDGEIRLLDVLLDSTRQQLVFVMQKGAWPVLVGMNWLDYVSQRDAELKAQLAAGIATRAEISQKRQAEAEEEERRLGLFGARRARKPSPQ
jgi:nucleotide-binding universal stress UspA family protein